jgi:hypothetical protein
VTRPDWRNLVVGLFLLASLAEFAVRGPIRAFRAMEWNDFLAPYIQAKAWVKGRDPYSVQNLISLWPPDNERPVWVDRDAANGTLELKRGMPTPYPISSLVIIAPFGVFSWRVAVFLWIVVCIAAVVFSPVGLLSICGYSLWDFRAQLFLAAAFALAPFHTGLATANPAMLAVSLTVATVWFSRCGWQKFAGIVLGVAICLKPTVAVGLLLYYLIRRRWKVATVALVFTAMIVAAGVLRMMLAGVPWLTSYIGDTQRIFAPGSLADFARGDAIRFNMINLQVLLYSLLNNASLANSLSRLFVIALTGWWLAVFLRRREPGERATKRPPDQLSEIDSTWQSELRVELAAIGAVFVLTLISGYHRFYDAALLIWPLAGSILLVRRIPVTIATLLPIAPFLISGPPFFAELSSDGRIPAAITHSWCWNAIIFPHEVWALLCLAIVLLYFGGQNEPGKNPPHSGGLALEHDT